jgi:hypothetical protein
MKNKHIFLALGFLLGSIIIGNSVAQANSYVLGAKITTAFYTDLDNDGFEDDVYAEAYLAFDDVVRARILLIYTLTLPSGYTYRDYYYHKITSEFITYEFRIYNGAFESGDYIFDLVCIVHSNGEFQRYQDTLVFDPPGGADDEPPHSTITVGP